MSQSPSISLSYKLTLPILILVSLSAFPSTSSTLAMAIPDVANQPRAAHPGHILNSGSISGLRIGKGLSKYSGKRSSHDKAVKGWNAERAMDGRRARGREEGAADHGKRALLDDEDGDSSSTAPVANAAVVSAPTTSTTSTAAAVQTTTSVAAVVAATTTTTSSPIGTTSSTAVSPASGTITIPGAVAATTSTTAASVVGAGASGSSGVASGSSGAVGVISGSGIASVTSSAVAAVGSSVSGIVSGASVAVSNGTVTAVAASGTSKAATANGTMTGLATVTAASTNAQGSVVYVTQVNTVLPTAANSTGASAMVSAIVAGGSTLYTTIYNTDASAASSTVAAGSSSSSDGFSTGAIVGVSVAGAAVLAGLIAFLVWKLRQKRFGGFDDDDVGIKWPELNQHGDASATNLPLPAKPTGGHGFATNEMERSEKNFLDEEDVSPPASENQYGADSYSNFDVAVSRAPSVNRNGPSDFIDDTPPPVMPELSSYGFIPQTPAPTTTHSSTSPRQSITSPTSWTAAAAAGLGRKKSASAMSVLSGAGEEVSGQESGQSDGVMRQVHGSENAALGRSRSGKLL